MGTVTYARHIYARAIASFEHCMMDSRVVSFIVHLLFNGDTRSFQTAPSARKCASIVFGKVRTIIKVSVFGKRTRLFQCKFCRHPLGKLGGVTIVRFQWANSTNDLNATIAKDPRKFIVTRCRA